MAYDFNAAEAFEMAIQIERNGAAFFYMKYSANPESISSFVVGRPRPE